MAVCKKLRFINILILIQFFGIIIPIYCSDNNVFISKETRVTLTEFVDTTYNLLRIKTTYIVPPGVDIYHDINTILTKAKDVRITVYVNDSIVARPQFFHSDDPNYKELNLTVDHLLSEFTDLDKESKYQSVCEIKIRKKDIYKIPMLERPVRVVSPIIFDYMPVDWLVTFESELVDMVPLPDRVKGNCDSKYFDRFVPGLDSSYRSFPLFLCFGESYMVDSSSNIDLPELTVVFQSKKLANLNISKTTIKLQNNSTINFSHVDMTEIRSNADIWSGFSELPYYDERTKDLSLFEVFVNRKPVNVVPCDPDEYEKRKGKLDFRNVIYTIDTVKHGNSFALRYCVKNLQIDDLVETTFSIDYELPSNFNQIDRYTTEFKFDNLGSLLSIKPVHYIFKYPDNRVLIDHDKTNNSHDDVQHKITYEYQSFEEIPLSFRIKFKNELTNMLKPLRWINFGLGTSLILLILLFYHYCPVISRTVSVGCNYRYTSFCNHHF